MSCESLKQYMKSLDALIVFHKNTISNSSRELARHPVRGNALPDSEYSRAMHRIQRSAEIIAKARMVIELVENKQSVPASLASIINPDILLEPEIHAIVHAAMPKSE